MRGCVVKKTNMFEVKDVGKLLDEPIGCLLLPDDDEIVDVAKNGKLVAFPDASITFQLLEMQLLLPKFWRCAQAI